MPPRAHDKHELKAELVRLMHGDLETLARAHEQAAAGATHEEAKPENDKDTRALEQSYLARGQARRVSELRAALASVEAMPIRSFGAEQPIAVGALVTTLEQGETSRLFLTAHGGGALLAGGSVRVVSIHSPLGQALLGKRAGDDCDVRVPVASQSSPRVWELSVVAVE